MDADVPFGPPPSETPGEKIPLVVPELKPYKNAHHPNRCKATTKSGRPCPMPAMNKVTEGYCLPHDPGVTKEQRKKFVNGFGLPRGDRKGPLIRHLRSPEEIMAYVEELIYKWESGPGAVFTVETLDCLANLLRIQLGAMKERRELKGGKKEKTEKPEWRDVG